MASKPIREAPGQSGISYDREHAKLSSMLVLWDVSQKPKDNSRTKGADGRTNREKKLGAFEGATGVAVCDFDPVTVRSLLADGIERKNGNGKVVTGRVMSRRLLEPDNWALRLHEPGGDGNDADWAVRLVADHTNKHNERTNRSTMVIDQQNKQRWGHLSEVLWVKDVLVDTQHPELFFDDAGFLRGLCENVTLTGAAPRYHTAFNVNREAGFITDGCSIGQLAHLVELQAAMKVGGNRDGEALVNAALRADVRFFSNSNQWGPLNFRCDALPKTCGRILTGWHWWDEDRGQCRGTEAACGDASEDGKAIAFKRNKGISIFVEEPFYGDVPTTATPPGQPVPSSFPSRPAGTTTPTFAGSGVIPGLEFRDARTTGTSGVTDIPECLTPGYDLFQSFEFVARAGLGGSGHFRFDYVVVGLGESGAPGALTKSIEFDIPTTGDTTLRRVVVKIPHSSLVGKEGGEVVWSLYRLGNHVDDTSTKTFDLKKSAAYYGTQTGFNPGPVSGGFASTAFVE